MSSEPACGRGDNNINKMAKSWRCCLLSLVILLTALCSDAGIISKSVCIGDSVQVFQNITSASFKIKFTLYKTDADKKEAIAVWIMENSSKEALIPDKYKTKVLFESGTILILNFQSSDEATYAILYDIAGWFERKEVQIIALAPPSKHCKPKIRHEENHLIASLDDPEICGKPVASVQWMEYPGISYRSKTVIELPPGKEAGTYYACIEGEALTCTKNSTERDKCEQVTIGSTNGNNSPILSPDIPQVKTTNLVIVVIVIVSVSLCLLIMIAYIIRKLWKKHVGKDPERAPSEAQMRDRQSLQQQNVADGEPILENPERQPLAQHEDIELAVMT